MALDLKQVTLESLSDIRCSFFIGKHPGREYARNVLVIRFEGVYRIGSRGNPDATFMQSMGKAAIEAFDSDALIIDLSALSYVWGDEMECVFGIGHDRPVAMLVGPQCREAIGTLCFGERSTTDACEQNWIFDSLDAAWAYVAKLLDESGIFPLHEAASKDDVRTLKQLLDSGEDPNRVDSSGQTPLHLASEPAIVKLLIAAGAEVNVQDRSSRTPLHMVKNHECGRMLLVAGADPDARDWNGLSPLGHVRSQEVAKLLIEAGADVHLRRRGGLLHLRPTPELAQMFIDAGVDVNSLDQNGQTPLDIAEESRQIFQRQVERFGFQADIQHVRQFNALVDILRANGGKSGQAKGAKQ